ncbi:MAG: ABC transporter ATP-binding protein [Phycisphaerae bacterium]|jgi:iron(III) transport system ATP-binding protein
MKKITIRDICKTYSQGGKKTEVLRGINIDIEPGEFFFLLGPSGCGKTTLLRIITGLIAPTRGQIFFDGEDVTELDARKRSTSMVFQNYALWPHMTVQKNVEFGLEMKRVDKAERVAYATECLELVKMEKLAQRKPVQLSGGQQQRVALARAIASRPDCLLLDEPLSNLDAKLRLIMRNELRDIVKKTNTTAIYVTHDQKEALAMADRIAIMNGGVIEQIGSPPEIYENPQTKFVADFIGECNFFAGEIIRKDGDKTIIEAALGELESFFASSLQEGKIVCGVRPENLKISTTAPAGQYIKAKVDSVVYLGEVTQIGLSLAGGTVWKSFSISRDVTDVRNGLEVFVSLPAKKIMYFGA